MKQPPPLTPLAQKFILHWGEMSTRWGINRTVAQVHALLYLSPRPLNAEEISKMLSVARSNVSTSLRELQSWGIVKSVHALGDRREFFESMTDVWEMFRVILEQRKRREVDPTLAMLRDALGELKRTSPGDAHLRGRLEAMLDFMDTMTAFYGEAGGMPASAVRGLLKAKGRLRRLMRSLRADRMLG